jgi:hypothetical protein
MHNVTYYYVNIYMFICVYVLYINVINVDKIKSVLFIYLTITDFKNL